MYCPKLKKALMVSILASIASPAIAAQLTLTATDLDYYLHRDIKTINQQTYTHQNVDAYLAGAVYNAIFDEELRNYFVFDLSSVSEQVSSAKFRLYSNFNNFRCAHRNDIGCGYASDDSSETLRFVDVETSIASLISPTPGTEQAIFNDLGEGNVYGEVTLTRNDVDLWLEIELSSAALDTINQSNDLWAIAGHVTTLDGVIAPAFLKQERLFIDHGVGVVPMPELVLTTIPVPAAVWLFGSGLLGLIAIARRGKQQTA